MDHMGRLGEVEANPARLQRQQEHGHGARLEACDHFLTFAGRHASVKEEGGYMEGGEMGLDQGAHPDELAEHEHRVTGTDDDVEQLVESRQLPGAARKWPGLVEVLSRVVADLFQHREQP